MLFLGTTRRIKLCLTSSNLNLRRVVGRSENSGVLVSFGGHNLPPLIEIGLTDLTKSGGAWHRSTTNTAFLLPFILLHAQTNGLFVVAIAPTSNWKL